MTDRIKGYLITLDGDWRDDDADKIENAIRQIRGVATIKPYVKGAEDYMLYEQGQTDLWRELIEFMRKKMTGK